MLQVVVCVCIVVKSRGLVYEVEGPKSCQI